MCGITGILHLDKKILYKDKLQRFTDSIQHRGPDSGGYYIDNQSFVGLGHRRLSILDLSQEANQPMSFADERYWIAYNGEVFNFLEIRNELKNKNYTFKTDSDTEVILASYHEWGENCLKKFNGMWAIAIWDTHKQELFLARDRFGIKPLYYLHIPNQIFAFASETYAFKFLDDYQRKWNENNLLINLQNSFALEGAGHTTFENIFQLLGGHYLKINFKDVKIQQKRWWNTLENLPNIPQNYDEQVAEFYQLFQDSSLLRLRADVPIATALSGGVDSSAVYCMLMDISKDESLQKIRLPKDWQEAFVATFPDTSLDEKKYAEEVINFTKGKANYILPNYTNLIDDIIKSTKLFDSIIITPINIVSDIYKQMSERGFKISMDGHGVDEMMLGYPHFPYIAYQYAITSKQIEFAEDCWDTYIHLHFPEIQKTLTKPSFDETKNHTPEKISFAKKIYQKLVPENIKNIYRKLKGNQNLSHNHTNSWFFQNPNTQLYSLTDKEVDLSGLNIAEKSLYENFHHTILPSILRNFDRASMQNSIEIRMPFMDYRLVSYVFALPLESKIRHGFTKRILRDAMKNKMPESIRTRKLKIGLNAPMVEWFSGNMATFILDEIHSKKFSQSNLWNSKIITNFAQKKIQDKSWTWEESCRFWTILNAHLLTNQS